MPRLVHLDPHPLSTRCAHFKGVVLADALPADDKPLAQSVFQARAEVSSEDINLPSDMYTSRSTKCVMFPGQGGWKYSRPYLTTIVTDDQPVKDRIKAETVTLGFTDIAHHGAVDDDSGLLFVGDKHRIKSYSWWDTQEDAPEDPIVPRHTMKSKGFTGAIGLLANGRVARAGPGKVAVWNVDDLPTHYQGSLIGKSIADDDCVADSCRDDYYEIELSRGSKPSSVIQSLEFDVTITRWHPHPDILGTMLSTTSEKRDKHLFCRAIDLEHAGQGTVRYRGHEGPVNQFSTSRGDANIFMTACTDGYARVFDTRSPRPQIKIQAGGWGQNCSAAVLCHPDGIPYIFLAGESAECITLWDVRAGASLYDLSTGNNRVSGLVWIDARNELYASTTCPYMDHAGYYHGYRQARIPRDAWYPGKKEGTQEEFEDEEWDDRDNDQKWPKEAVHKETYFEHIFDSGENRLYRYTFKPNPDTNIVPRDGH